eukprot:14978487-Alexandrium_andersonii.AAC.1
MRCARFARWRAAPSESAGHGRLCRSCRRSRGCGGASLCLRARRRRSLHTPPRRLPRLRGRGLSMRRGV